MSEVSLGLTKGFPLYLLNSTENTTRVKNGGLKFLKISLTEFSEVTHYIADPEWQSELQIEIGNLNSHIAFLLPFTVDKSF